jgi:hypothetical protein
MGASRRSHRRVSCERGNRIVNTPASNTDPALRTLSRPSGALEGERHAIPRDVTAEAEKPKGEAC